MKIFGLIASLFFTFFSIGQKSYYFSEPSPINGKSQTTVDKKWHGKYIVSKGNYVYEVNESGISMISTTISSISREEIRESSKYDVRNNYIFGIVENDSLPCVLENDRYFFGVRNREVIIGVGSKNVLIPSGRVPNEYILNVYENGYYMPSIIVFETKKISISQLDYDYETTVFDFIAEKKSVQSQNLEIVVLKPSTAEFSALLKNTEVFSIKQAYSKTR